METEKPFPKEISDGWRVSFIREYFRKKEHAKESFQVGERVVLLTALNPHGPWNGEEQWTFAGKKENGKLSLTQHFAGTIVGIEAEDDEVLTMNDYARALEQITKTSGERYFI